MPHTWHFIGNKGWKRKSGTCGQEYISPNHKKEKNNPVRNLSVTEMKDRKYSINKTILVFNVDCYQRHLPWIHIGYQGTYLCCCFQHPNVTFHWSPVKHNIFKVSPTSLHPLPPYKVMAKSRTSLKIIILWNYMQIEEIILKLRKMTMFFIVNL